MRSCEGSLNFGLTVEYCGWHPTFWIRTMLNFKRKFSSFDFRPSSFSILSRYSISSDETSERRISYLLVILMYPLVHHWILPRLVRTELKHKNLKLISLNCWCKIWTNKNSRTNSSRKATYIDARRKNYFRSMRRILWGKRK